MTAAAVARPRVRPAPDPLGARAPKLATLFGARREGRVLAAGAAPAAWEDDLAAYFAAAECSRRLEADALAGPYDLVLWAPTPAECGGPFGATLRRLRAALAPGGTLLLLARNALSLRALAHGAPGLVGSGARTLGGYRRSLRAAGFDAVSAYLALPSLDDTEEFASTDAPVTLSCGASGAERMIAAAGLFPALHDGFALVASARGGGAAPLLAALRAALPGAGEPVLERFALRDRGALVLRVRAGAGSFVCRAATGEGARAITRNTEWTRRLRALDALPPWLRDRIPAPAAELVRGETRIHAETAIDGVIGWMLAPPRRAVLGAELARFAVEMHRATAVPRRLDAAALDPLLPPRLPAHAAAIQRAYSGVRAALLHRVAARERVLACAHGDFGPGNALADAATGRLGGVIDWEGAGEDLAGVDLLNAAAQRRLMDTCEPVEEAFERVAAGVAANGFAAVGAAEMDARLPLGCCERAELGAWTALRAVLRAAAHPRPFAAGQARTAALLAVAGRLLARSEDAH